MLTDEELREALDRAWFCNNPALLAGLLRRDVEWSPRHCEWLCWFKALTSFRDRHKNIIRREIVSRHFPPFSPDAELAKAERSDLATFLERVRLGKIRPGNTPVPLWRHSNLTIRN